MREIFQNYELYAEWILENWNTKQKLDKLILDNGLMKEKYFSANGEPFRQLTREEFNRIYRKDEFLFIPKL